MEQKKPEKKNVSTYVKLKATSQTSQDGVLNHGTVDARGCAAHGVMWTRPPALTHEMTGAPPSGVTIKSVCRHCQVSLGEGRKVNPVDSPHLW